MTDVEWVASDPRSGRLPGMARRTSAQECLQGLEPVLTDEGYAELSLVASPYPLLALSFRNGRGVIHAFSATGSVALHTGDGSVPAGEVVPLPVIVDDTDFTGDVVLSAGTAATVLREFLRTGSLDTLGPWHDA